MSGSDLAPFVAAVLNDRTVAGLIQENNGLQSRLTESEKERLVVEVTGQNGSPIYYKGSMRNGGRLGDDHWLVHLEKNDTVLSLISLSDLEIWLGGTLVEQFRYITDNLKSFDGRNFKEIDNASNMGRGSIRVISATALKTPVVACTYGRIGPMLRTDYKELEAMTNVTQLMDLYQNRTAPGIFIEYIIFKNKGIRGIMALLEKLGTDMMEPFQPNSCR
ncbi:hypothetical protein FRACYDRAFT_265801 [Fragilariopsis cylindrus CCMP1102]|uniref:Uncharacterized protein n=1 Tax=Fragilariopsis cylindrus CCMP1102 TaxID=635003 RepID=A0A1E7EL71_9STRA|nr:hypothetical protein FRACYDRAFT_265801 [Fragilariopsis cylindrus CCMP1102]|eukprot:OEU06660.1 hypothetical protein FRACYDRAFT_265801 [Fragilariopsis cylindrus CCMP1102]